MNRSKTPNTHSTRSRQRRPVGPLLPNEARLRVVVPRASVQLSVLSRAPRLGVRARLGILATVVAASVAGRALGVIKVAAVAEGAAVVVLADLQDLLGRAVGVRVVEVAEAPGGGVVAAPVLIHADLFDVADGAEIGGAALVEARGVVGRCVARLGGDSALDGGREEGKEGKLGGEGGRKVGEVISVVRIYCDK